MIKINKSIYTRISFGFLIVLLVSSSVMAQNGTDWSDNFDDGDLSEWNPVLGTFSVLDGKLYSEPSDIGYACMDHPSNVAYGIWSFEILSEGLSSSSMAFLGNGDYYVKDQDIIVLEYAYAVRVTYDINADRITNYIDFASYGAGFVYTSLGQFWPEGELNGWQSINITRNTEGLFKIYINDTLRIEVTDNKITTSERFEIYTDEGVKFDNIKVVSTSSSSKSKNDDAGTSIEQTLLVMIIGISFMTKYQSRFRSA